MEEQKVTRRLAAILAADVVGYSRLVGRDEEGTLARLKALRQELIDPAIARHRGRMVKTMGDGVLVEYPSVVDALRNAVELQREIAAREGSKAEDRRIAFRVGVNLGDIVIEGDDILGDGVNLAARLEGLAEPGGICVSGAVFDQVKGKAEFAFRDLGEQRLKNIAEPVRVYRVDLGAEPAPPADIAAGPALPDKPSIAVLPFDNMSGDAEQAYFADGIAEDIITALSKISELFVIARNSSFTYKGRAVKVQQVGAELGVRYVLEGSVRRAGNRVRITAQLIDARRGGHLWGERFDRDLTDIFAIQDEVTREIVSALELRLTAGERALVAAKGTDNLEAYDHFLRGRELFFRFTKEGNAAAQTEFERAIALDPSYALAYAAQSRAYLAVWNQGWSEDRERTLDVAHELALKSLELDDSLPQAHAQLGHVLIWKKQHELAIAELEKCTALDPNTAEGYAYYGFAMNWAGRPREAVAPIEKAMRLDPQYPVAYTFFLGQAYFGMAKYEESVAVLQRAVAQNPNFIPNHYFLGSLYGRLGRLDEAAAEVAEIERLNPGMTIGRAADWLPYKRRDSLERFFEGLRKAGMPE